jgi:hypothetical protein
MDTFNAVLLGQVGNFVSVEHQRIAEILKDYDSSLELVFIPLEQREGLDDFPFAVYYNPKVGERYVVRRVRQQDMNENLVAWAFANDQNHHTLDSILSAHDAANEAVRLKKKVQYEEDKAARLEFTKSVLEGKNYYRHNGKTYR